MDPYLFIIWSPHDDYSELSVTLPDGDDVIIAIGTVDDVPDLCGRARRWAEGRGFRLDPATSTLDDAQRRRLTYFRLGLTRPSAG